VTAAAPSVRALGAIDFVSQTKKETRTFFFYGQYLSFVFCMLFFPSSNKQKTYTVSA
jgi:hypothetical protein